MSRRTRRRREMTRLLDLGAGVRVDLEPDSDLDNDWCLPLHGSFLPTEICARQATDGKTCCQPGASPATRVRRPKIYRARTPWAVPPADTPQNDCFGGSGGGGMSSNWMEGMCWMNAAGSPGL